MSRARGSQLYALLLRLYPKASRHEYETGMIEMFELRAAEAQHKNAPGRVWFVIRELGGLMLVAVRQRFMLNRRASAGGENPLLRPQRLDRIRFGGLSHG